MLMLMGMRRIEPRGEYTPLWYEKSKLSCDRLDRHFGYRILDTRH